MEDDIKSDGGKIESENRDSSDFKISEENDIQIQPIDIQPIEGVQSSRAFIPLSRVEYTQNDSRPFSQEKKLNKREFEQTVKTIETKRQTTTHGRRDHARLSNKPDGDSVISEIEEDSSLLRTKKTSELAKSISDG